MLPITSLSLLKGSDKGAVRDAKKNLAEYQSLHSLDDLRIFFLSAEGENYLQERGAKIKAECFFFIFLCENGLERTTKTITVGFVLT